MRIGTTAVVVALLLAGCGGGGGTRLSRDAYVAKADAVCMRVAKEQRALAAPSRIDEIPAYVDRALPILDAGVDALESLRPPADMEDGVHDWLATTGETRDVLTGMRRAAEDGDDAKARALGAKGTEIDNRRDTIARSLGLTACANT
jgi:hypothetical protein